jgi:hypothetical protein
VLAVLVGLFFLISPLITVIRAVTGGNWGGDAKLRQRHA